jgi:hypothetical protein
MAIDTFGALGCSSILIIMVDKVKTECVKIAFTGDVNDWIYIILYQNVWARFAYQNGTKTGFVWNYTLSKKTF